MKPQQKAAAQLIALLDWRYGQANPCVHFEIHINICIILYAMQKYLFIRDTFVFIYYELYK